MARNRNRQAGPLQRAVATPTPRPTAPSQNIGARTQTTVTASGRQPRARRASMTGAQRDSKGRRSDWSRPATLNPWTTPMTSAWSPTATTMPRGGVHPTASTRTIPDPR